MKKKKYFKDVGKKIFYCGCKEKTEGLGGKKTATTAQNSEEFQSGLREKVISGFMLHTNTLTSSFVFDFFLSFPFLLLH